MKSITEILNGNQIDQLLEELRSKKVKFCMSGKSPKCFKFASREQFKGKLCLSCSHLKHKLYKIQYAYHKKKQYLEQLKMQQLQEELSIDPEQSDTSQNC